MNKENELIKFEDELLMLITKWQKKNLMEEIANMLIVRGVSLSLFDYNKIDALRKINKSIDQGISRYDNLIKMREENNYVSIDTTDRRVA